MTTRYINVRKGQTSKRFHKNLIELVRWMNSNGIDARLTEHRYDNLIETGTIKVSRDYDFITDVLSPITRSGYAITGDKIEKC